VVDAHDRVTERALRLIPTGAPVSATNTLGAHLSERSRSFSFPVLREARWVAIDEQHPSYLDRADAPREFAQALTRLLSRPAWTTVFDVDGIRILHRE
jgi:hypothetical protein